MDALELKDATNFLRGFGDIHQGISSYSVINFPIVNEK